VWAEPTKSLEIGWRAAHVTKKGVYAGEWDPKLIGFPKISSHEGRFQLVERGPLGYARLSTLEASPQRGGNLAL
jgi:hypothetical protein